MKKKGGYIFSKAFILLFIIGFLTILVPLYTQAKVTGRCDNCHTMHNSQNGTSVDPNGPSEMLLKTNCVGCHSATDRTTAFDTLTGAPIVWNNAAGGPDYGASYGGIGGIKQGLAGGNFYWVTQGDGDGEENDNKGHNVFSDNPDEALASGAPGNGGRGLDPSNCGGTNSCHSSISSTNSVTSQLKVGLNNRQGCTKCHMVDSKLGPNGFHHAGDDNTLVNAFPWYRFLRGHEGAKDHGVDGIEDPNFQLYPSYVHNEYRGYLNESTLEAHNITSFCCGCHGLFHTQISGSAWIRHPSDDVIPSTGEYASAFGATGGSGIGNYNHLVPVAREDLSDIPDVSKVYLGEDMVMCLSCHRPHGSPYPDMLRWNYEDMQAGGIGTGGCFACHTEKDGS